MDFEHMNTKPPEESVAQDNQPTTPVTEPTTVAEPTSTGTPPAEPPKSEPPKAEPPKVDAFIEDLNKRYGTQYKDESEVKSVFDAPKKVAEYEDKLKDYDELVKSVEQHKKELEDLQVFGNSELLSKPLIRRAYVADQLQAKYPDRDPFVLQEIAMSDIDKMSDIEAIAKEKMISVKGLTLEEAKLAKLADFNIDASTSPEEWDSVAKARVKIAGAEAKERIKELLKGIELPKTVTKEEKEAMATKALEEKVKASVPVRETFKKFDKYVNGDFEFVVPDEYRAKLDDIFQGMFIDSGLEINESNLKNAEFFKRAMFIEEYFPKMKEVIVKQAQAAMREQIDKELHNDKPLNTVTATDQETTEDPNRPGVSKFFQTKENIATKL